MMSKFHLCAIVMVVLFTLSEAFLGFSEADKLEKAIQEQEKGGSDSDLAVLLRELAKYCLKKGNLFVSHDAQSMADLLLSGKIERKSGIATARYSLSNCRNF
ncbi:uncharacterized protein LOC141849915 [Brevipalpus obovatus]|uniref:uncharacterized protein LOC141849915 n=1 Tax=Brevipalpus obovatus TaxID=246614 RepID=UPI003D9E48AC